jgi:hypothetical protein
MMNRDDYRRGWAWKTAWYEKNGYVEGKNLFTTRDDDRGGLDSRPIEALTERIRSLL